MTDERIIYNGVPVTPDWPARLEEAQKHTYYVISGKRHERVRYGDEADDWGADRQPCHDCAALKGQFHFVGCDVERCPQCGGQAITCDCEYEDDEDEA